ncbi:adenylosuccinate lyase [Anaerolineales bacterium]
MNHRAISPLDGRYHSRTKLLADTLSEWALMKYRLIIELRWLIALSRNPLITHVRSLTAAELALLESFIEHFNEADASQIKAIEKITNHDVKAIEYFLREKFATTSLSDLTECIHFACTSEDINNLAYGLMFQEALQSVWIPAAQSLLDQLSHMADDLAATPMLSRTHGQAATPTTMGKELAVFIHRASRQLKQIQQQEYLGKFSGAVGAFNAHYIAYPDLDWPHFAADFVTSLGLTYNPLTTQIESHDYLAELAHALIRFNTVILDLCRDLWTYISLAYFKQQLIADEVGSSTMPHKINPIDFENAESNIGLSNALLDHLAQKLPVSRLQRDLSDSSSLRNYGVGIAHSLLALQSTLRGLNKLAINPDALNQDLENNWELLAEPIQTILRKNGLPNAYELLKELTRGQHLTAAEIHDFISQLDISVADKENLLSLTPSSYIGLAAQLTRNFLNNR